LVVACVEIFFVSQNRKCFWQLKFFEQSDR
jgi:hypothetical protein